MIPFADNDVSARVRALARELPDAPAITAPGSQALTFAGLAQQLMHSAARLGELGIARGDVLVWANADRVQTAVALAALPAGATLAPLNPAATFDALRDLLVRLRPKAVVLPAQPGSAIERAARELDLTLLSAAPGDGAGAGRFELVLAHRTTSLDRAPGARADWACLGATSGTTGRPKLVPHGHRQVVATARATGERLALRPGDILGHLMPMHLAGGIRNAFFQPLLNGAAVNVLPTADLDAFVAAVAAGEVTCTSASFTMLRELLARLSAGAGFERGRLRFVRVASGRLEPAEMDELEARLGVPVVTGLACSEGGTIAQQGLPPARRVRGSVGPPVDCELRLVDDAGNEVARGETGEVQVRGSQVFDGYFDDPALDAASFVDGWFRMGDLGYLDEAGELFLVGRMKEQINRGGDKISPAEIDAVLRAMPGVADAAAFPVPHPRLGEEVVAAVVLQPGAVADESGILQRARDALGANRAPRRLWFVTGLPRTDGGKLRRAELPGWVDRHAITAAPAVGEGPAAELTPMQTALAALWASVLQVPTVPAAADFFMLGGDSLRGAQLVALVRAAFGVELPPDALFADAGTVVGMARRIENLRAGATGTASVRPTIPRRDPEAPVPLSGTQLRAWFLHRLDPRSAAYNEARLWHVHGRLDVAALRLALAAVAARQPMLRTRFVGVDGEPRQVIEPAGAGPALEVIALPPVGGDPERLLARAVRDLAAEPFDLAAAPPIRWTLFELGPDHHALLRVWHHILGDGLSAGLLQQEVSAAYAAALEGRPVGLPPLAVDYADYAAWQARPGAAAQQADALDYWKARLADLPVLALPADFRRPPTQSFRGGVVTVRLAPEPVAALKALGRRLGATPFVAFLAAYAALLSRLSGDEDLAIGTPVAGRPLPELAEIIGFFASTLVLRADLAGAPSAEELLLRTRDRVREMLANDAVPFERLVEALGTHRDPSRNPLFQVAFGLRERDVVELQFPGARVQRAHTGVEHAKFDLTLALTDGADGMDARWEFCADVFSRAAIERMARQYELLVAAMAAAPGRPVGTLSLMDEPTQGRLLAASVATGRPYPAEHTIHRRFGEIARTAPRAPAVGELDYGALDAASSRLARELRAQGAGPSACVAVSRASTADVAVAWLAVLKAGAAYLPIDPELPAERLAFVLADARVAHAIADPSIASRLAKHVRCVISPEQDAARIAAHDPTAPDDAVAATDPAYVIYTSGSTGTPKGVVVPHRAVLRLTCDTDCTQVHAGDTVAQMMNPAFDASTFEYWSALLNGARLAPIAKTTAIAPRALAAALASERVTVIATTTALLNAVAQEAPDALRGCRIVIFGGEAAEPRCVAAILRAGPPQHLLNVYGPTEAATFATYLDVRSMADNALTVPIGGPAPNNDVFILRPDLEPAAPGEPGEIVIGGPGLALGYLNPDSRSAAQFIERPVGPLPPRRLYRTGDRARWRDDGTIEFLGRTDGQIKLRGHRIELEEIEAAIARSPQVRAAVCVLHGDTTDTRRVIAYVVAADPSRPPPSDLVRNLRAVLPDYMLPASVVWLRSLPLNASGKVDRRALPAPTDATTQRAGARVPPRDMFELVLAKIWERLLGISDVGVFDHFFEQGGHSLLAARLVDEIERETGLAAPLPALFLDDTIAGLSRVLREGAPDLKAPILAIHGEGRLPPFVFLHGDFTGGGFYSRSLAQALGPDQPVLIVHPHGLVGDAIPDSIEAMAADRIGALRARCPHGPYVVGGHCNGALIAFEMARQLVALGEEVQAVVIIEARAPSAPGTRERGGSEAYVTIEGGRARMLAPRDRLSDALLRYAQAMDRYVGGRFPGHLIAVRAGDLADPRPELGWSAFADSVEVHRLPGDHRTLVTHYVGELATALRGAMRGDNRRRAAARRAAGGA